VGLGEYDKLEGKEKTCEQYTVEENNLFKIKETKRRKGEGVGLTRNCE